MDIEVLFLVMTGGAAGAVARYGLNNVVTKKTGPDFPFGTLVINVSGSFLAGIIAGLAIELDIPAVWTYGMLTGFLGSFTTFSTWMVQSVALIEKGQTIKAAINIGGSVAAGLTAAVAGLKLAFMLL